LRTLSDSKNDARHYGKKMLAHESISFFEMPSKFFCFVSMHAKTLQKFTNVFTH
jgi:hypothetical protein